MYPNGHILWVATIGLGLLLALCISDALLVRRSGQPAGRWIQAWARSYPVLAFLLAAVIGLMMGHFYWSTAPPCPPAQSQVSSPNTERDCLPAGRNPSALP